MRLLLLLFFACSARFAAAQTGQSIHQPAPDYEQQVAQILAPLDLGQVPGGYLHDRAGLPPVVELLDGGALDSSNVMLSELYGITLAALGTMSVDPNNVRPPDEAAWDQAVDAATVAGPVELSVTALTYGRMRPDAVDLNLFDIINDQLHDVPNRPGSPYTAHTFFGAISDDRPQKSPNPPNFSTVQGKPTPFFHKRG